MKTQRDGVLEWLKEGKGITPLEALDEFGCFRLANVVFNLKKEGYHVVTKMVKNGRKGYARYFLIGTEPRQAVFPSCRGLVRDGV